MEDKKRYRHQLYRRFSTYVDDWAKVSMALTHMDVSKYDLTDEDVKDYIVSMRESQEKYKKFKKIRLWWWIADKYRLADKFLDHFFRKMFYPSVLPNVERFLSYCFVEKFIRKNSI